MDTPAMIRRCCAVLALAVCGCAEFQLETHAPDRTPIPGTPNVLEPSAAAAAPPTTPAVAPVVPPTPTSGLETRAMTGTIAPAATTPATALPEIVNDPIRPIDRPLLSARGGESSTATGLAALPAPAPMPAPASMPAPAVPAPVAGGEATRGSLPPLLGPEPAPRSIPRSVTAAPTTLPAPAAAVERPAGSTPIAPASAPNLFLEAPPAATRPAQGDALEPTVSIVEPAPTERPASAPTGSPPIAPRPASEIAAAAVEPNTPPSRTVARVGDEVVNLRDLTDAVKTRISEMPAGEKLTRRKIIARAKDVLKEMIIRSLVMQEARAKLGPEAADLATRSLEERWRTAELPELLRRERALDTNDLRAKLSRRGTSPEAERELFVMRALCDDLMRRERFRGDFTAYLEALRERRPVTSVMSSAELAEAGEAEARAGSTR
ncbi:MAG: hypothetical protein SFX72_06010 [Isosphaeraceae bacterium]|nr:hypothetical protein [Isosphaeraceae bacterium]